MRLGMRDHKVLAAFVDREPMEGHKLSTDGERLDGHWIGGARIAEWIDGPRGPEIALNDLGSRAAESVQRAIRHHAPPALIGEPAPTPRIRRHFRGRR